jgi:hypothetical protein
MRAEIHKADEHPSKAIDKAKSLHLDFARTTIVLNDCHAGLSFKQTLS